MANPFSVGVGGGAERRPRVNDPNYGEQDNKISANEAIELRDKKAQEASANNAQEAGDDQMAA